ncbi:MAG: hypothetical protein JXA18_00420 [Chitinispirillaceae bacterium]|nr:hypothetical protein [Chitinispirillaceae bacterium]
METAPGEKLNEFEEEFRSCLFAELEEIMKYKWFLGEAMKKDPLESMSMNEICLQWIEKYAKEFREYWKNKTGKTERE